MQFFCPTSSRTGNFFFLLFPEQAIFNSALPVPELTVLPVPELTGIKLSVPDQTLLVLKLTVLAQELTSVKIVSSEQINVDSGTNKDTTSK